MTELDVGQLLGDLGLALAAFVLALPVGWDRFKRNRPAGLRTFPIVALASCAFVLIGKRAFAGDPGAQARIVQGLMTGIGFVGGGAILKGDGSDGGHVPGIATAASIWNTGAIGAAVGFLRFEVAIVLSVANFLILHWLEPERVETGRERARETVKDAQKKVDEAREKVGAGGEGDEGEGGT
ncbi:MAG: MgtC/SapB family protein [Longimicrobiales bacterium]|nr:MgtC/SapB family protein [Longimicrobiales bacterium]